MAKQVTVECCDDKPTAGDVLVCACGCGGTVAVLRSCCPDGACEDCCHSCCGKPMKLANKAKC